MAVFKCKMCGASLEIAEGMTVAECAYCGTEQTLPKLNDNKANLYDRANHFRRNNDYDKAMSIYERILNEDTKDAEAYWSLVLCRYGIEYVEDPLTRKRVPTVNRTQHTSVFADEDYKSAIKYADVVQRRVYENEARAIDKIQKGILAISQKEKPFDVFICYKETGADGRRTRDSVLANDLYHQLTQEGFKVFFSRITLEDKLGTAYEPYIFSALNSAKVMVVLGTKPEYFNAVWVKNEWSRYLALIRKGEKKVLIPAYRDMDPYDLPDEFSHLQAQDMSKLGFMQDLIRGIKKLTNKQTEKPVVKEVVREVKTETTANTNTAPLLRRGYMFLEDKEWNSADEYFEKVLDLEPENGKAYLGKLLATLKCSKLEDVEYYDGNFRNDKNYQKVLRYGDSKTKEKLQYYVKCYPIYWEACNLTKTYSNAEDFITAKKKWQSIADYRDSKEKSENCIETVYIFLVKKYEITDNIDKLKNIRGEFLKIADYKNAKEMAKKCLEKCLEKIYNGLVQRYETTDNTDELKNISTEFSKIAGYKNAKEMAEKCLEKAYNSLVQRYETTNSTDELKNISTEFSKIAGYKNAVEMAEKCLEKAYNSLVQRYETTDNTDKLIDIRSEFLKIAYYKNAKEMAEKCLEKISDKAKVVLADEKSTIELLENAVKDLEKISYYEPANKIKKQCYEKIARLKQKIKIKKICVFTVICAIIITGIIVVNVVISSMRYNQATQLLQEKKYTEAYTLFLELGDFKDSKEQLSALLEIISNPISAGSYHTVGLKKDGTVVAVGRNYDGQCDVSGWKDIVAISAGYSHTVGLKKDGTVVAVGSNKFGQCDVSGWKDIVAISAGTFYTVGLKKDGTVVAVGDNEFGQCDVSGWKWKDIVAISAGYSHTVGLKKDGTVVAVGRKDDGQCDVSDWKDILPHKINS